MPKELWLVPHRDGMLRVDAEVSPIGPHESAVLELLIERHGQLVAPDDLAARIWGSDPDRWPEDYQPLIQHRLVTVRKLLPAGFIVTVYDRDIARFLLHGGRRRMIGWRLTGKIHIHRN